MPPTQSTGIKDAKMLSYGTTGAASPVIGHITLKPEDIAKVNANNPALAKSIGLPQIGQAPTKSPEVYQGIVARLREYRARPKTGVLGMGTLKSPRIPFVENGYKPMQTVNSNRPTRNNNPLNIKYSEYTKDYEGVLGIDSKNITDGGRGFIVFKTPEQGFKAAERLLRSEGYQGMTVDQAMKRWSNSGYDGSIVPHIKNKPVEQLQPDEMRELILTMAKREGYNPNMSQGGTGGSQSRPRSLGVITTMPGTSTNYEKSHPGVDIANKPGTPIPSFVKGTVVEVVNNQTGAKNGYGNYVIVKDADGNMHRYSHLSNSYVKVGQPVGRGTVLGGMGNTGATYSEGGSGDGTHLDYRVVTAFGKYMNPMTYVKYLS